ncbi:NCE101 [Brettanomyces bruxellensis]|uniref:DEBR0S2_06304g1_1 n=1 Tax=Dekkera bruxellensis TaxID=5007 RepID=A0A3F2Y3L6_DEKBR|nr:NCE101 [Brettanomyces bruxellensis]
MMSPAVQQFQHYPHLISKWMDPIFAISMGVAAYYLYERRVGREPGHTLNELIARKYQRWRSQ